VDWPVRVEIAHQIIGLSIPIHVACSEKIIQVDFMTTATQCTRQQLPFAFGAQLQQERRIWECV
jgi:hypothetical protein